VPEMQHHWLNSIRLMSKQYQVVWKSGIDKMS